MESSIAVFLKRWQACELPPTTKEPEARSFELYGRLGFREQAASVTRRACAAMSARSAETEMAAHNQHKCKLAGRLNQFYQVCIHTFSAFWL